MTKIKYKVLIIDDHPLITDAYKSALDHISYKNSDIEFDIDNAIDCDSGLEKLIGYTDTQDLDLVFLDMKLPPSSDGKMLSGEDLGIKIKSLLPQTKIIVLTTYNDNYRIHNILQSLNPDGFLIKNDITPEKLVNAIEIILEDPPYYSQTVIQLLRKQVTNEIILDRLDRKILYELSIGTRMKDLPNILPLSIAGIEKRKRQLKEIFDVKEQDDKDLLLQAKERGFI